MAVVTSIRLSEIEGSSRLDPDFYHPKYLEIKNKLSNIKNIHLLKEVAIIDTGPAYSSKEMGSTFDIPLARIGDITNRTNIVQWTKLSKKEFERFKNKKIENLDILVTMTGDPPDVGKCNLIKISNDQVLAFNQRVAKLMAKVSPYYLFAYLCTETARLQSERNALGIRQRNVRINDIRSIRVVLTVCEDILNRIDNLTINYLYELERSKSLYSQAENLLLEELRLEDFKPKYELSYTANLSKAFGVHRVDAEYFQPVYETLIDHITRKDYCRIRDILTFNKRGVQPLYVEDGQIAVVTSKHLGRTSIDYHGLEKTSLDEWEKNKDAQISQYDILTYTTGAYVGRANCFLEEVRALASNHINILRVRKLNPVFVSVYLNSVLGQMQVERCVTGSAQVELYPSQISNFVVWNAPQSVQNKIATFIQQSHEARKKAKELLEEAKRKVEEVIEGEMV